MDYFDSKQLALLQIDPEENASLEKLLSNENRSLLQLLSIKHIQPKIRTNFTPFIKHCQKHEKFSFELIDLGIKHIMQQSDSQNIRQACFIATDALTCDQDIVADLLILPDKSKQKKNQSDDQRKQQEQIEESIQTEAQHSAGATQAELVDSSLSEQEKFNKKYKYLMRVLSYITEDLTSKLDENCINYMIKSLNCLIRKKAEQFLEFLQKKPQVLKRLIELNNFSSINQFLIKILSDDEVQSQISQQIKKFIIDEVLNKLKDNVISQDFGQRLDFLDQLFQTNKYASEDDRTELQKLSDIFSSKSTIEFFYEHVNNPSSPTDLFNSITYLSIIIKRMNVDEEIDPYSYSNEPKEQTMVFQIDILFKQFPKLLTNGYKNLINFQYPQEYKQKTMETRFYELLVLLTKNSRLSNCSQDIKHESIMLKGNNTIFLNYQQKINTLKELLKQFSTQTKSGINSINIIALMQKILNVQIYQEINHSIIVDFNLQKKTQQEQNEVKQVQKQKVTPQNIIQPNQKVDETSAVDEQIEGEDKKKKINKIKAGLKLNIKKFSLQNIQPEQKPLQQVEVTNKKQQEAINVKKLESSLKKNQVVQILRFFSQLLKSRAEFNKTGAKKKFRNNQTQIFALINKIIVIFCNSISWAASSQDDFLNNQKDAFIIEVQTIFPFFNFEEICRNYSTTLATSKHPNASARQKTNPQLNFISDFFKNYSKKKETVPEKIKQSSGKNLQLSDSDFKSDDNEEEEVHAVKCTLQDFKKFTSFKFQNQKNPKHNIAPQTQRTMKQAENSNGSLHSDRTEESIKEDKQLQKKVELQNQNHKSVQNSQTKNNEQKLTFEKNVKKEDNNQQIQSKEETNNELKVLLQEGKNKLKQSEETLVQKIPLQFYIKHRMIFV